MFADLTGQAERGAVLEADYRERVAALRDELAARHPRLTVSIVSSNGDGTFSRSDIGGGSTTTVAHDVGLLPRSPNGSTTGSSRSTTPTARRSSAERLTARGTNEKETPR